MKIEQRRLVDIIPYKQNARKIPQRAIDKVALSLKEFGRQQPIVIDNKGVIVVGHTRWPTELFEGRSDLVDSALRLRQRRRIVLSLVSRPQQRVQLSDVEAGQL